MGDLTDRYVLANLVACALALAAHVGVAWLGLFVGLGFAPFALTVPLFLATMATHPAARVHRLGPIVVSVRMDWSSVLRWTPVWCLAVTALFLVYIAWFVLTHRVAGNEDVRPFAACFAAISAHLLWSGVGTRLGALRMIRAARPISG